MTNTYGNPPTIFEEEFYPEWDEYMHYLYLPVVFPTMGSYRRTVPRLPERLEFLRALICDIKVEEQWCGYIYVTARRGYATPGNPLNRPGWHTDGFGSDDINYIWTDKYPTVFAVQDFHDISKDHVRSIEQFEEQIDTSKLVGYPLSSVLRLDASVVHAAPLYIPPPGSERGFFKISLSQNQYNLRGNSHNYLFNYHWKMWSRDEVRNDPTYAGGDAGPQA